LDRLPVPDVTDRAAWAAVDPRASAELLTAARVALADPLPALPASGWARAFRDGVRTEHEDAARALRHDVALQVVAAVLTGEVAAATDPPGAAEHLDRAVDGLVALGETSTWCWAPHDRGAAERGEVLPDPDRPFLDLGAAEVASLVAWSDHVLGPHLDMRAPGLRRRLRREVEQRVLGPFERVRDWHWIGRDGDAHNWNPWIHGAVLEATIALVDDPMRRDRIVALVVDGLDHFVRVQPDDGGVDEGVQYWWLGAGRLLESLELLPPREIPVLAQLIRYPYRMHLGGDWYVNVGDGPARLSAEQPWHVLHRWGVRMCDEAVQAHARSRGRTAPLRAGLGRALTALADPEWRPVRSAGQPWLAAHEWLPRVQVLVARESAGTTRGLTVAAKAGHNAERHNHLDVGTYWVAVDGRPLVVDVGQPTYTAGSFGPERYRAWPLRSSWHNVPEPGCTQEPGPSRGAADVHAELGADTTALHADLAAAYPGAPLRSWRRTVRLVRGDHPHALVTDRWDGEPEHVLLRHVLAGEVELGEGFAVVTAPETRPLRISWEDATAELEDRELDDPLLVTSWSRRLTRLTLRVTPTSGAATVRMEVLR
jgi:heparinase II/III-like protein